MRGEGRRGSRGEARRGKEGGGAVVLCSHSESRKLGSEAVCRRGGETAIHTAGGRKIIIVHSLRRVCTANLILQYKGSLCLGRD